MTIFRFNAAMLGFCAAGCGPEAISNLPDAQTPLGKIARTGNFEEQGTELRKFAEARKGNPEALDAEFCRAGFAPSKVRDDRGDECQSYDWESKGLTFPTHMLVNICGQEVSANAGQTAP